MLKRLTMLAAVALAMTSLTACGVVAAFIPDQEVGNALGVDGEVMEGTVQSTEPEPIDFPPKGDASLQANSLMPTAATTVYVQSFIAREIKNSDETIPIDPKELIQPIGVKRVTIIKPSNDGIAFADTLQISGSLNLFLWDDFLAEFDGPVVDSLYPNYAASAHSIERRGIQVSLTLNKDSDNCTTVKCVYLFNPESTLSSLTLDKTALQTVETILKPGTNSNTVVLYTNGFALTSDPGLVEGSTAKIVLNAATATVKF